MNTYSRYVIIVLHLGADMARVIEYDPQEVLEKTMALFWNKGYEATSIQDIVAATGLKPGSIYAAYTNKEGMFKAVVDLYTSNSLKMITAVLTKDGDVLQNIHDFLTMVIVDVMEQEEHNGCLLVKTLLVASHKDERVQQQIAGFYKSMEPVLVTALQKAKDEGVTNVDVDVFANFIISTVFGSHVHYKTFKDINVPKQNVAILMDTLTQKKD